jgi:hypothetical protein
MVETIVAPETPAAAAAAPADPTLPAATFITLRGELRADGVASMPVELVIRPEVGVQLGKVNGVVRYMQGDQRVVANVLEGEFQEAMLVLRETKPLEVDGAATAAPAALGREFVIRLPANAAESDDLSGAWSFGDTRGTLLLVRQENAAPAR